MRQQAEMEKSQDNGDCNDIIIGITQQLLLVILQLLSLKARILTHNASCSKQYACEYK